MTANNYKALNVKNLFFSYNEQLVLNGINWSVDSGVISALLGPNGSGKTTFLKILAGVLKPTDGKLTLDNVLIRPEDQWLKSQIGFLPEEPFFYMKLNIKEMIYLVGKFRDLEKDKIKYRSEFLLDKLSLTPYLYTPIGKLSLGTRRRVGLVTVLLHEPKLILLDEPTNGLDPEQIITMRELLKIESQKGNIVILSTHQLDLASRIAQEIAVLSKGKLLYSELTPDSDLENIYLSTIHKVN